MFGATVLTSVQMTGLQVFSGQVSLDGASANPETPTPQTVMYDGVSDLQQRADYLHCQSSVCDSTERSAQNCFGLHFVCLGVVKLLRKGREEKIWQSLAIFSKYKQNFAMKSKFADFK